MKTHTTHSNSSSARIILGLIVLIGLLSASTALAQTQMPRIVFDTGGQLMTGPNQRLNLTVGQPVVGTATGDGITLGSGFWASGTSPGDPVSGDPSVIAVNINNDFYPLDDITAQISVGSATQPVTNLLGVGFEINFNPDKVGFDPSSLTIDSFFSGEGNVTCSSPGSNVICTENHNAADGVFAVGVSRIDETGVSGEGTVMTLTFTVLDEAEPGDIDFTLSEILAIDTDGNEIDLTPTGGNTYIAGIWPGDIDNDCGVDGGDLLGIGISFGNTGPVRLGGDFDISWEAKPFSPWGGSSSASEFSHSFVDATGDGTINQNDVLPLGFNYGESRNTPECPTSAAAKGRAIAEVTLPVTDVGDTIPLYLNATASVTDLLGIAFKMNLPPDLLDVRAVRAGTLLDDGDLLAFDRYNADTGLLDAAFTRKGTNPPAHGTGTLVEVELDAVGTMTAPVTLALASVKLSASDGTVTEDPATVALSAEGTDTATATEDEAGMPEAFMLHGAYPNPFNPTTTIAYDLPEAAEVMLLVYDVLGRQVHHQLIGQQPAGAQHQVMFEAQGLASGTYLYRVVARLADRQEMQTGRFVLMK